MLRGPRMALFALAWLGCSQTIEVLSPPPASEAGGSAGRPAVQMGRAGAGGRARDPDDVIEGPAPCGRCPVSQLCAVDRCIGAEGITALDASLAHTCMVKGGQLFCWGKNESGALGTGDTLNRDRPTRVGSFNDWLQVSAGESNTCAIRAPGQLYCFGSGSAGENGLGDTDARSVPVLVPGMPPVRSVACGGRSCCAIAGDGTLYCWGENREGKIGQDDPYGAPDALVPLPVQPGTRYRAVEVGQGHACAIEESGALYCWGRNTLGELGIGGGEIQLRTPVRVGSDSDWLTVSASQHHSCGVRANGVLACWGHNGFHEVGAPELDQDFSEPRRVDGASDWASVAVGWFHTCASKRDRRLFCIGRAIEGQLAVESVDPLPMLNPVSMPEHYGLVTLGQFHTCAVDEAGQLYCWGVNDAGQLGVGDDDRRYAPEPVR